jgi:hypothetical protein
VKSLARYLSVYRWHGWFAVIAAIVGCTGSSLPEHDVAPPTTAPLAITAMSASPIGAKSNKADYRPRPVDSVIAVTESERVGHLRMQQTLAALQVSESKTNSYYGSARAADARQRLSQVVSQENRLKVGLQLTFAEMDLGHEDAALEEMSKVQKLLDRTLDHVRPQALAELRFLFGMVYLRHGETENCCLMHNKDSCLLPIRGGGVHTRQAGSRAAIAQFAEVVELLPHDSQRYLEAVWLWNLASMTLGKYPDGVPEPYRIDPAKFLSREPFPRLMNRAVELGLDTDSLSGSVIADDFNNDGYLDLMVGTFDLREPLRLYLNDGHGKFVDQTSATGLAGMPGGLNMVQGDYNNDGRIDVYVLRGAWLFGAGRHPDSLLRNNGDGTFTDVTLVAGLADANYPSQTAAWGDYDLDGQLDLYVGGEETPSAAAPCRLFHNNGDGTFTDVAESARVTNNRLTKGVVWGDYNDDRYPDLYVSNLGAKNRLFRNNGNGTFTDVARRAHVADVPMSFPTWFWDYDNDGVLDLFVASFDGDMAQVAKFYLGQPVDAGIPHVFRGTPSGEFFDATRDLGLVEPTLPMGSNFGDLDNDGYLDMYLGTGSPDYKMILPNKLYHNLDGQTFSDISEAAGLSHLQKGHGVAFADLDADGDQDVFIQMGGAYPVDKYYDALYENPGFDNNSVAIELVGNESNRFGVGSRIRIKIEEEGQTRSIYRWVNSGGSFGGNPLRNQIGVGRAAHIASLEIYWPKTDTTQLFEGLPVNCIIRVTEGSEAYAVTNLRPADFSPAAL